MITYMVVDEEEPGRACNTLWDFMSPAAEGSRGGGGGGGGAAGSGDLDKAFS